MGYRTVYGISPLVCYDGLQLSIQPECFIFQAKGWYTRAECEPVQQKPTNIQPVCTAACLASDEWACWKTSIHLLVLIGVFWWG